MSAEDRGYLRTHESVTLELERCKREREELEKQIDLMTADSPEKTAMEQNLDGIQRQISGLELELIRFGY